MTFSIGPARPDDLPGLAALAEDAQSSPETFIGYYGEDRATIAAEIEEVEEWAAATVVARTDGKILGWLLAETEPEIHRIWWWGPVVAPAASWDDVADALYRSARDGVDASFDQEELAADDRSDRVRSFAERHGFTGEEASVLLRVAITTTPVAHGVEPLVDDDHDAVVAMHDRLFHGTHTPGRQLVGKDDAVQFVVRESGVPVGYVSVDLQPDGAGYVDYLGVTETERGRGLGRLLVAAALDELRRRGIEMAFLTVRESNAAARSLYASLGFDEERLLRPYRRGFSLP